MNTIGQLLFQNHCLTWPSSTFTKHRLFTASNLQLNISIEWKTWQEKILGVQLVRILSKMLNLLKFAVLGEANRRFTIFRIFQMLQLILRAYLLHYTKTRQNHVLKVVYTSKVNVFVTALRVHACCAHHSLFSKTPLGNTQQPQTMVSWKLLS